MSRSSRPLRVLHPPSRHPVGSSSLSSRMSETFSRGDYEELILDRLVVCVCVHLIYFVQYISLFSLLLFFSHSVYLHDFLPDFVH